MPSIAKLWRRSIQARVVTSTIVLSTLVIGLTGWALLRDVASGLAESRRTAAIAEAQGRGARLGYVTNNAFRTPDEVADHLRRLDVPATPDQVITSSQAAAALLRERLGPGASVLVCGGRGLTSALLAEGLVPVSRADERPAATMEDSLGARRDRSLSAIDRLWSGEDRDLSAGDRADLLEHRRSVQAGRDAAVDDRQEAALDRVQSEADRHDAEGQLDPDREVRPGGRDDRGRERAAVAALDRDVEHARVEPARPEHVVDDPGQPLGLARDDAEEAGALILCERDVRPLQGHRRAVDRRERRAELV